MPLAVDASVRVLPPFAAAFPGSYRVVQIGTAEDGEVIVYLADIESAFSPLYLEVIND